MNEMKGRGWWLNLARAAVVLLAAGLANAQSPADESVVEAVWKPQRVNFVYRGYSTLYSCRGLQQKLEKILTTVGARGGIEMRAYSCDDALAIARFQIVLTSPVEATPENVEQLTTYDARDELVARVRGERLAVGRGSAALPRGVEDDLVRTQPPDAARTGRLRAGAPAAPAHPAAHGGASRERSGALLAVRQHRQAAAHRVGVGAGGDSGEIGMNRRQFAGVAGALVGLSMVAGNAAAEAAKKKILFVLSNGAAMGEGQARSNLWEVAEPHHVFVMHGYQVDFVSPRGGRVPFSLDEDESDPPGMVSYTIKYEGFRQKANATMTPDAVVADEYAGVFIGGGAGPLFDVANDSRLLSIIARIYESGGVVGGGGHGPGSFSNVKLSTRRASRQGKKSDRISQFQ